MCILFLWWMSKRACAYVLWKKRWMKRANVPPPDCHRIECIDFFIFYKKTQKWIKKIAECIFSKEKKSLRWLVSLAIDWKMQYFTFSTTWRIECKHSEKSTMYSGFFRFISFIYLFSIFQKLLIIFRHHMNIYNFYMCIRCITRFMIAAETRRERNWKKKTI